MKQLLIIIFAIFFTITNAQEPQGIKADVELLSGIKQHVQFLGIENDTVQLGGYIKNQFTIVKIHKNKFKSITDKNGTNLLIQTDSTRITQDSTIDSTNDSIISKDSIYVTTNDSITSNHSTFSNIDSISNDTITTLKKTSDIVFITFDGPSKDSSLLKTINTLTINLLREKGENIQKLLRKDFVHCDDDICIQKMLFQDSVKKIYLGKLAKSTQPDSILLELSQIILEGELPIIHKSQIKISKDLALNDVIKKSPIETLIQTEQNDSNKVLKNSTSYIFVDTDPEGATISRSEKNAICKTPCTFATTDTGKIEINAYWNVESKLWGTQSIVRPIPNDTTKVSLKLKPISPEIHLITSPSNAEVFPGSKPITKKSKSIGFTPNKFTLNEPGIASITLRHIGYKDTLVSFFIAPVNEIKLNIEMEKLNNYNEIEKQIEWQKSRNKMRIGHSLMASSLAPLIVSTLFFYLANTDYNDAKDLKNELKKPGLVNGENYQNKVSKNKELVDSGDKKMIIGTSLAGASVLLFGVGLFISF